MTVGMIYYASELVILTGCYSSQICAGMAEKGKKGFELLWFRIHSCPGVFTSPNYRELGFLWQYCSGQSYLKHV